MESQQAMTTESGMEQLIGESGMEQLILDADQGISNDNFTTSPTYNVSISSTYRDYGIMVVATLSVFLVISMVLALVGNTMVILTIARHRGMRTRTNLLLANLAVADILVAIMDMPIALITIINGDWIFTENFCYFNGYMVGLGLMLSIHTLMWISIHKFVSITRPFSRSVTPGKIVLMILAAWGWTAFFNLTPTPLLGWTDTEYKYGASQCGPPPPKTRWQLIHAAVNTLFNLVIPFTVMIFCYYRIFKEVKSHLSRMRDFADMNVRNSLIQQKRITETLCIVLSVFFLFWLPYICYSLSLVFLGKESVPEVLNPIAYLFGYMNSACNPIIYALRSPSFRRGFSEIICKGSPEGPGEAAREPLVNTGFGRVMISFRRTLARSPAIKGNVIHNKKKCLKLPETPDKNMSIAVISRVEDPQIPNIENPVCFKECDNTSKQYYDEDDCNDIMYSSDGTDAERSGDCKAVSNLISEPVCPDDEDLASKNKSVDNVSVLSPSNEVNIGYDNTLLNDSDILENAESDTLDSKDHLKVEKTPDTFSKTKMSVEVDTEDSKMEIKRGRGRYEGAEALSCSRLSASSMPILNQLGADVLPTSNVDIDIDEKKISKSNCEIVAATAGIMLDHVKSASVGDIRVPKRSFKPKNLPKNTFGINAPPRMLVWQPSVDKLCGSPLLSRQKFFDVGRAISKSKSGTFEQGTSDTEPRKKKTSASSVGGGKQTLSALITNVKKSFSDLFNLEGEIDGNCNSHIESSSEEEFDEESKL